MSNPHGVTLAGAELAESETFITAPLTQNPYADNESRESLLIAGPLQAGGMKAAGSATQQDAEQNMLIAHALRADGFDASEDGTERGTPLVAESLRSHPRPGSNSLGAIAVHGTQDPCVSDIGFALGGNSGQENAVTVNFSGHQGGTQAEMGGEIATALRGAGGSSSKAHALTQMAVRRLLPRECARLQGFPDDYLEVEYRGKLAADGPMYKAYGNSMAVPVLSWILSRLK